MRGLMSNLMDGRVEQALNGLTVTTFIGYRREMLLEKLSDCGEIGMVVLPEHLLL